MEKLPRYRTGDSGVDRDIASIIEESGPHENPDLLFEMVVSALRMGRERVDRGEMKLVNTALKELRYAFHVFEPYRDIRKCTIFGSARTKESEPAYHCARDFGAAMAKSDWMVITGAGPGIMAAGMEGAGTENSFGVNIHLPFEASANEFITGDPKLINFRYFFTRKVMFMKESHGYALLPGGFGTLDEGFELLTLMQTGKSPLTPVVMLDPPGETYWKTWKKFVEHELLDAGLISADDLDLVQLSDDVDEAVDEICSFYRTYHSSRYVGKDLVLRLHRMPPKAELDALTQEFSAILEGPIVPTKASPSEIADRDVVELERIKLRFDRHGHARLRQMINRLNRAGEGRV